MKILSIETSCDETAVSIIDAKTVKNISTFDVLGNALLSQIKLHAKYGGVFPMMAKREHGKALIPLLKKVLIEAKMLKTTKNILNKKDKGKIEKILSREGDLLKNFLNFIPKIARPEIDRIAVTSGPGLEPTLWVGINFAIALSYVWNIPIIPVNHMEGHIISSLMTSSRKNKFTIKKTKFPVLSLLISGGHTELVIAPQIGKYKVIGATRDDAVGEAFDKVARMLGLPYPGGPEISRLAKNGTKNALVVLPRPMINSKDFDFSFSGLKTSVLYLIKKIGKLTPKLRSDIAKEFENSVTEVLTHKTLNALKQYKAKTLVIGGGVSANEKIRNSFIQKIENNFSDVKLYLPEHILTTDNALMIAVTAYFKKTTKKPSLIKADGNLGF